MNAPDWTYAEMWESVARELPDEPAFVQAGTVLTHAEFDAAADALAAWLLDAGLTRQSKVAAYCTNGPEYCVTYYAAFKAGLVPFNVNYRYGPEEVAYLLDDGDAEAVIFNTAFLPVIEKLRRGATKVKTWIAVPDGQEDIPHWAENYRAIAAVPPARRPVFAPWGRSGNDVMLLYTGGTTGMPKGVMWRQGDLIGKGDFGANPLLGLGPLESPGAAGARAREMPIRPRSLIACPLMHGTGLLMAFVSLTSGGAVLLLPPGHFSAEALWDLAAEERATRITIVGQPFAQPMLEALDADPGRWDLSSVMLITSSGAMWNRENKKGLLRHLPQATLMDSFSSSEAIGLGLSLMTADEEIQTARFVLGPDCAVFKENGEPVKPGSGERGRVAIGGYLPLGYYKDEVKTEKTFPVIDGKRWSIPGDWAEVAEDGSLILLGRGSQSINTGGEKVFPEEVEEVLKRHDAVRDAAVAGIPDTRFGEQVVALVELRPGADIPGEAELIAHVRAHLAHYKAPRRILFVDQVPRSPAGKMDYARVKLQAQEVFAPDETTG